MTTKKTILIISIVLVVVALACFGVFFLGNYLRSRNQPPAPREPTAFEHQACQQCLEDHCAGETRACVQTNGCVREMECVLQCHNTEECVSACSVSGTIDRLVAETLICWINNCTSACGGDEVDGGGQSI